MRDVIRAVSLFFLAHQQVRRRTRTFREHFELPPLQPVEENGAKANYTEPVPVLYTNDPDAVSEWITQHISERPMIVGWDTESSPNLPWRHTRYVGPATVQISTLNATMVLEIASEKRGPCPEALIPLEEMLADSKVLKAGVGINQDMLDLYRWDSRKKSNRITDIFGRFDIGGIGSSYGRSASLKKLVQVVLGLDLPKRKKIAMSNWAKAPLTTQQIHYAARDAWVAVAIMEELHRRDPSTFSISAILDILDQETEQTMRMMDERAVKRKKAKTGLFGILRKGDEKRPRSDLSEDELEKVEELEGKMKEFSPPSNIVFDIDHLGLSIWGN